MFLTLLVLVAVYLEDRHRMDTDSKEESRRDYIHILEEKQKEGELLSDTASRMLLIVHVWGDDYACSNFEDPL